MIRYVFPTAVCINQDWSFNIACPSYWPPVELQMMLALSLLRGHAYYLYWAVNYRLMNV